jgi:hypothetical protein
MLVGEKSPASIFLDPGSDMAIDRAKLEKWFGPKSVPTADSLQDARCHEVRLAAKRFAESIMDHTPASADQSAAIREVRQALQWSVEAIVHESI